MAKDKFTATWVSHTSIADFLNCPRAYYLRNVYRRPETNHKIQLVSPPLSLGSAIHEVLESLSVLPTKVRFTEPLLSKFDLAWEKYHGRTGGFFDVETEYQYKKRGQEMIKRVEKNPGPLAALAVKINMEYPYYYLSESDNIILGGRIDWLQYFPDLDTVKIIDFKTGRHEEDNDSLQLPIYVLVARNCQKRNIDGAAYWYLESSESPTDREMPDLTNCEKEILEIARKIKLSKTFDKLKCPSGGCKYCDALERISRGEAELVGVNSYGQDCFILPQETKESREGQIL